MKKPSEYSGITIVNKAILKPYFPMLGKDINKGDLGRVIIVGGSSNYVGAILLSAEAAMRSGAGTSMIASTKKVADALRERVTFSGLYPLSGEDCIVFDKEQFDEISKGASSFAVGMGMAKGDADKIVGYLYSQTKANFVVDAEGLKSLGLSAEKYDFRAVFTPHPKEFSYISGLSVDEILNNPIEVAKDYAVRHKVILLLKGFETVITDGKSVLVNTAGAPKMAKGGSGDVLSGVIAAQLARGIEPLYAAAAGAYLCGMSAEISDMNEYSYLPSETIRGLVKAIDELTK